MTARKIRTSLDESALVAPAKLGGWLQGKQTYLWIGDNAGRCIGLVSGYRLYRLAKAIVAQWEAKR